MKKPRGLEAQAGGGQQRHRHHGEPPRAPPVDQLEVERIEHLRQLEAFLGSAVAHVIRIGIEGPLDWPALVQRPDGSRVQATEEVVERATELIEGLCRAVDTELRNALKLAPDADRKKYRLLARRDKDVPETSLQHPDLNSAPTVYKRAGDAAPTQSMKAGVRDVEN